MPPSDDEDLDALRLAYGRSLPVRQRGPAGCTVCRVELPPGTLYCPEHPEAQVCITLVDVLQRAPRTENRGENLMHPSLPPRTRTENLLNALVIVLGFALAFGLALLVVQI